MKIWTSFVWVSKKIKEAMSMSISFNVILLVSWFKFLYGSYYFWLNEFPEIETPKALMKPMLMLRREKLVISVALFAFMEEENN